jgi:DNA-binding NarL/FixJ family response regulator
VVGSLARISGFPYPHERSRMGRYDPMGRSILVVDDDPAFRGLAVRLLTRIGLEVVGEAETVAEAFSTADSVRPDAALVDVDLPDGNGIDLAQQLTAQPWAPRVILTSVYADAAGPDAVRRSGAVAFVHKADLADGRLRNLLTAD